MAYLLATDDRQRIAFLEKLGGRLLHNLQVPFTRPQLEQAIYRKYILLLSPGTLPSKSDEEIAIADKDDPSNLAMVLLEAMKEYYIQSTITESPEINDTGVTLAILPRANESQSFEQLLCYVITLKNGEYAIPGSAIPPEKSGVENYIAFRRSVHSAEEGYESNHARLQVRNSFLVFAGLLLSGITAKGIYDGLTQYPRWLWVPPLLFLLAGVVISLNLFRLEKLHAYMGDWAKKICSARKEFNCQKVLGSAGSKLFGIISLTDLGMIYFCTLTGFVLLGLLQGQLEYHISILFWCSLATIPWTIFAVYYQVRVVKKICPLCLMIQAILWLQAGYLLYISPRLSLSLAAGPLVALVIATTLVACIYFLFAYNLRLQLQYSRLLLSEQSLKNNPLVFKALADQQAMFEEPELPGAVMLGNTKADDKITVVLSLTCSACGDKLREMVKIVDWFGESIGVIIYIKPDPHTAVIVKKMLAHSLRGRHAEAVLVLSSWFDLFKKNYASQEIMFAEWQRLYPGEDNHAETGYVYQLYLEWHAENFIPHTPFLAYNNRVLPNEYNHTTTLKNIIEQIREHEYETEKQS